MLLAVALKSLHVGTWVSYVSILCVMGYIVGFAIGPGPVPWIWATEFFKQSARAAGASKSEFDFRDFMVTIKVWDA